MKWQDLEKVIKQYAQTIWLAPAVSETINGVKCDCVVKKSSDYYVLVEISKSGSLAKLRTDLAKFATVKPYLFSQNIYAECIFVTEQDPSSLLNSAEGKSVKIFSILNFFNQYFGSEQYKQTRINQPFGSAIDPESGVMDTSEYIPIKYIDEKGKEYSIKDISDSLKIGTKIVILGEFGSGKSRCVMEVFKYLTKENAEFPPLSLNLRDTWGLRTYHTIIAEHFARIGLSSYSDNFIRSVILGHNAILLDGFDELGTQSWSGDKKRIKEVRKKSFEGVRDLINATKKSGILITGRAHYFNDNTELFECLDIKSNDILVLKCPEEFSESETKEYLKKRIGVSTYPQWFPRKPLLCQVLTKLSSTDINSIINDEIGELKYFEKTLDVICKRETKFNPAVYAESVRELYYELAKKTKEKDSRIGPLTITDIYTSFEKVTGSAPLDESIVLLQRLAYLGRTEAASDDRVFIDEYIADGITALAIVDDYYKKVDSLDILKWKNSIGIFGSSIIGSKIKPNDEVFIYLKKLEKSKYSQLSSDIFSGMLNENNELDCKNLAMHNSNISYLNLSGKKVSNIIMKDLVVDELVVEDCEFINVIISDGIFGNTFGVTSRSGLPSAFINCDSSEYENASNTANISQLNISDQHKTLLIIIKKLFFQPGGGRKEEALLRGSEKFWDKKAADQVLNYLISKKMIEKYKGDTGPLYCPQRKYKSRLGKLYAELNNSTEELWKLFV